MISRVVYNTVQYNILLPKLMKRNSRQDIIKLYTYSQYEYLYRLQLLSDDKMPDD